MEDQKLPNSDQVASFWMIELQDTDDGLEYAFMYNDKRFFITINSENLRGDGDLLEQFNALADDIEDPDNMYQLEDWVLEALDDFFKANAPAPPCATRKPPTLFEYFSPQTFALTLVNEHGKLCPIPDTYRPDFLGDSSPKIRIIETTTTSALLGDAVLKSALPSVPYFLSSEFERVDDKFPGMILNDMPRKVRRRDTGEVFSFKAGLKSHGHLREIDLLHKISQLRELAKSLLTSKLVGLVVWDDDNTCLMGFLLEYIEGKTLRLSKESATA